MKFLFLVFFALFVAAPANAQLLSDSTGLVNRLDVQSDGHTFEIETVSNFNIHDFTFDKSEKSLTIYISSGLENNLGEMMIPKEFLDGNFTFYLNGEQYFPKIKSNDSISFVTLNFTGTGENKLEVFGTVYLEGAVPTLDSKDDASSAVSQVLQDDDTEYFGIIVVLGIGTVLGIAVFLKRRK